ncbi:MAG: hypothetical protein ACWGN7_06655 [Thermodesulfovibrionales bacterium]
MRALVLCVFFLAVSSQAALAGESMVATLDKDTFVVVRERGDDTSSIGVYTLVEGKVQITDYLLVREDRLNQSVKYFRYERVIRDINVR